MKQQYQEWIDNNVQDPHRKCREVTEQMQLIFPELLRVKGHVSLFFVSELIPHWWLETIDGEIVDPTASQFGSKEITYMKHEGPEPTGRCFECGEFVFNNENFCNTFCSSAYMRSLFDGL